MPVASNGPRRARLGRCSPRGLERGLDASLYLLAILRASQCIGGHPAGNSKEGLVHPSWFVGARELKLHGNSSAGLVGLRVDPGANFSNFPAGYSIRKFDWFGERACFDLSPQGWSAER